METFPSLQSSLDRNFTRPECLRTLFLSQIEHDESSGNFRAQGCIRGDFFGKHQRCFYKCCISFVILLLFLSLYFLLLKEKDTAHLWNLPC